MTVGKSLLSHIRGFLNTPWSITTVVRTDQHEWRSFNRYIQRHSLSRPELDLLYAGEHPIRFSVSLFALFLTLLALGQALPDGWFVPSWAKWQAAEQLTYFSTLWTVQTTLAALVYPIVIAFVTVFLQRRPASETFVHLYVLDSGALAAGLSALALVVVMAVQYMLLPVYGAAALPNWVAVDALWFALNAALTAFFLFRTIDFLRPEVQLNVMRRYAVNVALPRDVMRLYSFQVLGQAHNKAWIPAPSYGDENAPEGPKILLGRYGFRKGEGQGKVRISRPARLVDVYLWPLRAVVISWMRAAQVWPRATVPRPRREANWPLLTVAMTPGATYRESFEMANVEAGPHLEWWQRIALRSAFRFVPVAKERYGIRVKAILEELEADARVSAGQPDVEQFERAYDALVSMHELLLGASLVRDESGSVSSWALLPDIESFAERPLYWEWADSYRSIFLAAVRAITVDVRPIRRLCHLVRHLDGEELNDSPVEIRENVLQLPSLLMFQIANWWNQRVEEQGDMQHGGERPALLRAPLHRTYEDVLSAFVGGWEDARTAVAAIGDASEPFNWQSARATARLNMFHLQETARMLLSAVSRGDRVAAEWFGDILSKWLGGLQMEHEPFALYGKTDYLTVNQMKEEWTILAGQLGIAEDEWLGLPEAELAELQRAVLGAAIQNAWEDIRLLVVEILIAWGAKSKDPDRSLAMEIAVGVVAGKHWRPGGLVLPQIERVSAEGYVKAKFRQFASEGQWRDGYIGMLDRFVERIKDMERPEMVSSRVYSFSGADNVASLQDAQLILLAALSRNAWGPSESIRRRIDIWLSRQYGSIEIVRDRLRSWIERLEKTDQLRPKVLSALLTGLGQEADLGGVLARARSGIESLRGLIEAKRTDVLSAEPVDPERLAEIGRFASALGFAASGECPMGLFARVEHVTEELENFTLTFKEMRKGEFTKVEMDQRAANEEEFWGRTMANRVAVTVLSDVLSRCKIREVFTRDADAYWAVLKSEAERIRAQGHHAVLLLDNATRPGWVWRWQHAERQSERERPEDLRVTRSTGRADGYVCNFNEIEVYVAPLAAGQSVLLSREAFDGVSFTRFEEGRFVDVTYEERSDTKLLLDLKLRFSRRVQVANAEALRLNYIQQEG